MSDKAKVSDSPTVDKTFVRYELTDKQRERLKHWHYHGNVDDPGRFEIINDKCKVLAELIMYLTPECRQQSIALTDLESVRMWANSAIAVYECMVKGGNRC